MRRAWLLCCALGLAPSAWAQNLSFHQAIERAGEGPSVAAGQAGLDAARHAIGPAGALPDPQLVLALDNVPVTGADRFRLNRDEMTMQRVGIMQDLPSGRRAQRALARALAERADAEFEAARLEARLGAAEAWISAYFAVRKVVHLERLLGETHAAADAARARLAGGGGVDAALGAEIEAARAADRLADAIAEREMARAELERWIGEGAAVAVDQALPVFDLDIQSLREHLRHHPALAASAAETDAAEAELRAARAERVSDMSVELSYGRRDRSFGDMASLEVRLGLPLFQGGRQGPLIEARRAGMAQAAAERDALERQLLAMLEARFAEYQAVSANLERARRTRLPRAQQRAAAITAAFAAGSATAEQAAGARREAIDAELEALDLERRRALIGASLALQYTEQKP